MISRCDAFVRSLLFLIVRLYQRAISPLLIPSCRFSPSCSNYALEVLQTWPLGRGLWLIVKRLARCQPFGSSGFDPVPVYPGKARHRILQGEWLPRPHPKSTAKSGSICASSASGTGGCIDG